MGTDANEDVLGMTVENGKDCDICLVCRISDVLLVPSVASMSVDCEPLR